MEEKKSRCYRVVIFFPLFCILYVCSEPRTHPASPLFSSLFFLPLLFRCVYRVQRSPFLYSAFYSPSFLSHYQYFFLSPTECHFPKFAIAADSWLSSAVVVIVALSQVLYAIAAASSSMYPDSQACRLARSATRSLSHAAFHQTSFLFYSLALIIFEGSFFAHFPLCAHNSSQAIPHFASSFDAMAAAFSQRKKVSCLYIYTYVCKSMQRTSKQERSK